MAIVKLAPFVNKFVHELLVVGVVKTSGTRPPNSRGCCRHRETISEGGLDGPTLVITVDNYKALPSNRINAIYNVLPSFSLHLHFLVLSRTPN